MRKSLIKIIFAAGALALAAAAADNVGGKYTCFGKRPYNGQPYGCKAQIEKAGEIYRIKWTVDENIGYAGVGVLKDGYLCVGYESYISYGVAIYEIKADGTLDGVFGLPGFKETGSEKFYPEDSAEGAASE